MNERCGKCGWRWGWGWPSNEEGWMDGWIDGWMGGWMRNDGELTKKKRKKREEKRRNSIYVHAVLTARADSVLGSVQNRSGRGGGNDTRWKEGRTDGPACLSCSVSASITCTSSYFLFSSPSFLFLLSFRVPPPPSRDSE